MRIRNPSHPHWTNNWATATVIQMITDWKIHLVAGNVKLLNAPSCSQYTAIRSTLHTLFSASEARLLAMVIWFSMSCICTATQNKLQLQPAVNHCTTIQWLRWTSCEFRMPDRAPTFDIHPARHIWNLSAHSIGRLNDVWNNCFWYFLWLLLEWYSFPDFITSCLQWFIDQRRLLFWKCM